MLLHIAVIEYPSDIGEEPELVVTTDKEKLHDLTPDLIAEMLDDFVPDVMADFRAAFAANPDNFVNLIAEADESLFVTFYTKEI